MCRRPSPLDELIAREDGGGDDDSDRMGALLERLEELMLCIPRGERELVRLALAGKTQREMAEVTGLAQASVCTGLRRAVARLRYHAQRPDVDVLRMATDLMAYGRTTNEVAILAVYLQTACMSEVARRLEIKLSTVRSVVERAPALLSEPKLRRYLVAFEYVRMGGLLGRG
jgi:DNA-directed RNA polymerase specialized sigma24 family protein